MHVPTTSSGRGPTFSPSRPAEEMDAPTLTPRAPPLNADVPGAAAAPLAVASSPVPLRVGAAAAVPHKRRGEASESTPYTRPIEATFDRAVVDEPSRSLAMHTWEGGDATALLSSSPPPCIYSFPSVAPPKTASMTDIQPPPPPMPHGMRAIPVR